jgi:hypothetical protein
MSIPLLDGAVVVVSPPVAGLATTLSPIDGAATTVVRCTAASVLRTGVLRGRLLRCHPFHLGRNNPVPPGKRTQTNLDDATGAVQ